MLTILLSYLLAKNGENSPEACKRGWFSAVNSLVFFALGAGLTVLIKQSLAILIVGQEAFPQFMQNLTVYMTPRPDTSGFLSGYGSVLSKLFRESDILTYGNAGAAEMLLVSAGLAWVAAASLALLRRDVVGCSDTLALLVGAGSIALWAALLPTHTHGHAFFMSRILIVPYSLGWAALAQQLVSAFEARSSRRL